jgi:hypothetical protein
MIQSSKALTDGEIQEAARYFSTIKLRASLRVVETEQVPKKRVANWVLAALESGGSEPIGKRIIEVPESLEDFESRDSRASFVAYVSQGSVQAGAAIVRGDASAKIPACVTSHGHVLRAQERWPS